MEQRRWQEHLSARTERSTREDRPRPGRRPQGRRTSRKQGDEDGGEVSILHLCQERFLLEKPLLACLRRLKTSVVQTKCSTRDWCLLTDDISLGTHTDRS